MGNTNNSLQLGKKGEDIACQFLEKGGHRIICRNYRAGRSELDIISEFEQTLIITEVKSYFARPLAAAEFRVNKRKQQQIIKGAHCFLDQNPKFAGHDVRLDVIVVDFSSYPATITQHKAAFWDEGDHSFPL